MIRLSSVFWLLLVSATALATFAVKYEVQTLDDRLADARKATGSQDRELHVLDAEWAYLNRPDMLAAMNGRFLSLAPIGRQQLQTRITDIPMRPTPAPPPTVGTAPAAMAALDGGPQAIPPVEDLPPEPGSAEPASSDDVSPANAESNRPVRGRSGSPEKLALATSQPKPLLVKAAVMSPTSGRERPLDSQSLDHLIARIAAGR